MRSMIHARKARVAAVLATVALSGGVMATTSAQAQPVVTGGLVNVTITDVLNNNTVTIQLPIGVAANVCGVNAAVLAQQFSQTGTASCTATVNQPL